MSSLSASQSNRSQNTHHKPLRTLLRHLLPISTPSSCFLFSYRQSYTPPRKTGSKFESSSSSWRNRTSSTPDFWNAAQTEAARVVEDTWIMVVIFRLSMSAWLKVLLEMIGWPSVSLGIHAHMIGDATYSPSHTRASSSSPPIFSCSIESTNFLLN